MELSQFPRGRLPLALSLRIAVSDARSPLRNLFRFVHNVSSDVVRRRSVLDVTGWLRRNVTSCGSVGESLQDNTKRRDN